MEQADNSSLEACCTGFLSAPTVLFYLDSDEDGEQANRNNRHVATVREDLIPNDDGQQKVQFPSFLLNHLVS